MKKSLPGPGILESLFFLPEFKRHYPHAFLLLFQKYGSVYRIDIPFRAIFAGEPRLIEYVLKKNAKNYTKSKLYDPLRPIIGNGLVTSEGETWKKSRRIIAPEFHPKSINGFIPSMLRYTQALSHEWTQALERNGGKQLNIDLSEAMMGLTLAIVGETFFGDSMGSKSAEIADNLYVLLEYSVKQTFQLIPMPNKQVRMAEDNMNRLSLDLIQKRKQGLNHDRQDVLSRLLLAKEMDDSQLLDEVKTLILAGHETTSLLLTWCWYLLAKNPEVEKKLHDEVDSIDHSHLEKLTYTRQVILETMRLYPPIPVISRQAIEEDEFEGIHIPKGMLIQLAPYVTHRDPRFWENPDEFIPERFSEDKKESEGLTYFPFAAGQRACIGEHFAMTEAIVILATLASQFRFRLKNPEEIVQSQAINTLRPIGGLNVFVNKR